MSKKVAVRAGCGNCELPCTTYELRPSSALALSAPLLDIDAPLTLTALPGEASKSFVESFRNRVDEHTQARLISALATLVTKCSGSIEEQCPYEQEVGYLDKKMQEISDILSSVSPGEMVAIDPVAPL
jgi:hypothetical protein